MKDTVTCVFGSHIQAQVKLVDPAWCLEHCTAKTAYERHKRPYDCFWHLQKLGIELNKK